MKQKKVRTGPIRTEVVIPFLIIVGLIAAYFHFFFDRNLKWALETGGYHAVGAEVNIADLRTSFLDASFKISGVQVTDGTQPQRNLFELGQVRFNLLWDGLLRAKFVVEEMAVEGVKLASPRKTVGRVKPPPPPSEQGPSAFETALTETQDRALNKTKKDYANNILGDLAALLSGTSSEDQLKKIEGTLLSKQKIAEVERFVKEKELEWKAKIEALPKPKDLAQFEERFKGIKTSGFANPQELIQSVNALTKLVQDVDKEVKNLTQTSQQFRDDLKSLQDSAANLEKQIKADIAELESRLKIPKIDANNFTEALIRPYLDPILGQFQNYKNLAEKYLPPKFTGKKETDPDAIPVQPRPRAKGVVYEFGRLNSYPWVWIQKIKLSSEANAQLGLGKMQGLIEHITTNQRAIGRPTTIQFNGDFPGQNWQGLSFKSTISSLQPESVIDFQFAIAKMNVEKSALIQSDEVQLTLLDSTAGIQSRGVLKGLLDLQLQFEQKFITSPFEVLAKNNDAQSFLQKVFGSLPPVSFEFNAKGRLPKVNLGLSSNIGPELQTAFSREIQAKINELKKKIQDYVNQQVSQEKAKIEAQIKAFQAQAEGEIKKVQAELEGKKRMAESKINEAKGDTDRRAQAAQKDAENQAKKKVEEEAKKAAEELKKRFGL